MSSPASSTVKVDESKPETTRQATSQTTLPPKSQQSRRRHRRIASEELGRNDDQVNYFQYPPTQISYQQNNFPQNNETQPGPPSDANFAHGGGLPVHPYGMPGISPYPQEPPTSGFPPFYTAVPPPGNPIPPLLNPPSNGDLLPPQQGHYNGSRRKRKSSHRRVHSYSGSASYGSLLDSPPVQKSPVPSNRKTAEFSPRQEFMKLTSGFNKPPSPYPSPANAFRNMTGVPPPPPAKRRPP